MDTGRFFNMAIRNIVKEGDEVLKKVCRPVDRFDDHLKQLVQDMKDTCLLYTSRCV